MTIGVSIPAYVNVESLRRCLDSTIQFLPEAAKTTVVVDDGGNGQVSGRLRDTYPDVRWIIHDGNQGFGASATEAVSENPADIVVLLNDDVELLSNPSEALRDAFADPNLFAVTFQSLDDKGRFREGAKRLVWRTGYPRILHNENDQLLPAGGARPSSYAVGGHAAFRRKAFMTLSGFDRLYDPFYWEDVDLALRAAKHGWHCIYLPECIVRHRSSGAIRSRHDRDYIREITQRNRILFAMRHATARQHWLLRVSLLWMMGSSLVRGDAVFRRALAGARARWSEINQSLRSDSQTFSGVRNG